MERDRYVGTALEDPAILQIAGDLDLDSRLIYQSIVGTLRTFVNISSRPSPALNRMQGLQNKRRALKAVEKYAGTLALIQSDSDSEPKILASDIGFALKKSGWNVRFITEEESHIPPGLFPQGGVTIATLEAPFFVKKDTPDSRPELIQPAFSVASTAARAVENLLSLDLGPPLGPMFFGVHWQPEYPGEMAFITKYGFEFPPGAVLIFVGTRPLDAALQPIGVDSPTTKAPSP